MTVAEVPIGSIQENDYNPRFETGNVDSLADSIEKEGLLNPPTVRPVENGTYEVIAGERRLKALRSLYDDAHVIEVSVRDVDDQTARKMAVAENVERDDLSNMEEAWAYAAQVAIEVDGEEMTYDEYVGNLSTHVHSDELHIPARKNSAVEQVADDLSKSSAYISERLGFLTLPEAVRDMIHAENLPNRAARELVQLGRNMSYEDDDGGTHSVPVDTEWREDAIMDIIDSFASSDGEVKLANSEYGTLKSRIDSREDQYVELYRLRNEELSEYEDLLERREETLRSALEDAIEWYRDTIDEEYEPAATVEGATGSQLTDAFAEVESTLTAARQSENNAAESLSREIDEWNEAHGRMQRAVELMAGEDLDHCPYCQRPVDDDHFDDGLSEIREEIDDTEAEMEHHYSNARELRTRVEDLTQEVEGVKAARERLAEVRDQLEEAQA